MTTENMNVVIVGHVDHGKSTLVGRLMADTGSLPDGKLQFVKDLCAKESKKFEYAFLIDALESERQKGITIDMARCFFKSKKRRYLILDAPGHLEFLKNMISGASRAEAAVLVIDASQGMQESTRRHAMMCALLGVPQLVVVVNKMDLVNYQEQAFQKIKQECQQYLKTQGAQAIGFIPVSSFEGEGLIQPSQHMTWYEGLDLLQQLDALQKEKSESEKPFRMPLQDVYSWSAPVYVGRPASGSLRDGDSVIFYPSKQVAKIRSIEVDLGKKRPLLVAGYSAGVTLDPIVSVKRGEVLCKSDEAPMQVLSQLTTKLFWLGGKPMQKNKTYILKIGTAKVGCKISQIKQIFSADTLMAKTALEQIEKYDIAEAVLSLDYPIAVDQEARFTETRRFVVVDNHEICGGGLIGSDAK